MKGYKVFNSDWTCRGFQYEVGQTYEMTDKPQLCEKGFHFCISLKDCFLYYPFDSNKVKIAEVEALGEIEENIISKNTKCCTNKIKIVREILFDNLYYKTAYCKYWTLFTERLSAGDIIERGVFGDCPVVGGIVNILGVIERVFNTPLFDTPLYDCLIGYTALLDAKEVNDGIS